MNLASITIPVGLPIEDWKPEVEPEKLSRLIYNLNHNIVHDGPEHEVLGKALVHAVRNMQMHVAIVPFAEKPPKGWPWGSAHSVHLGGHMFERHIEAFVGQENEWVHHMLGHCDFWTSTPTFITEYTTEQEVLRIAKELVSVPLYEKMTQWAKENVRMRYYNSYIHDSPEIAEWCGYEEAAKAKGE